MLKIGEKKYRINFSDTYIVDDVVGNVGDNETRNIKITIVNDDNMVVSDPDIIIELLCKPEGEDVVYRTVGEYNGESYVVKYPNSVFTKNQIVKMQIIAKKGTQQISTPIFTKEVKSSILGEVTEDRDIYLDLSKVHDLALDYLGKKEELKAIKAETENALNETVKAKTSVENYKNSVAATKVAIDNTLREVGDVVQEIQNKKVTSIEEINNYIEDSKLSYSQKLTDITNEKKEEIGQHAQNKIKEYNNNASEKTQSFNTNAETKKEDFNSNSRAKTEEYNRNAILKTDDYNTNHDEKIGLYNENHNEKLQAFNNSKNEIDLKINNFNTKYPIVENLLTSEEQRVEAEKNRVKHDEKIQKLLNDGLNAELGEYAKKTDLENYVTNEQLEIRNGEINGSIKIKREAKTYDNGWTILTSYIEFINKKGENATSFTKLFGITNEYGSILTLNVGEEDNNYNYRFNNDGEFNAKSITIEHNKETTTVATLKDLEKLERKAITTENAENKLPQFASMTIKPKEHKESAEIVLDSTGKENGKAYTITSDKEGSLVIKDDFPIITIKDEEESKKIVISGNIELENGRITGLSNPQENNEVANKEYVDTFFENLKGNIPSGVKDFQDGGIIKFWSGTQLQYDNIQEKDASTVYFITSNRE